MRVIIFAAIVLLVSFGASAQQRTPKGSIDVSSSYTLAVAVYGPKPWRHTEPFPDKASCMAEANRFLDLSESDDFPDVKTAPLVVATCIHNRTVDAKNNDENEQEEAPKKPVQPQAESL